MKEIFSICQLQRELLQVRVIVAATSSCSGVPRPIKNQVIRELLQGGGHRIRLGMFDRGESKMRDCCRAAVPLAAHTAVLQRL